jgi:hypothetical protein
MTVWWVFVTKCCEHGDNMTAHGLTACIWTTHCTHWLRGPLQESIHDDIKTHPQGCQVVGWEDCKLEGCHYPEN